MHAILGFVGRATRMTQVRRLAIPLAAVMVLGGLGQPVRAATPPPLAGAGPGAAAAQQAARARAESLTLAAKSHLTTAELIKAAAQAGSRLAVHARPAAPAGPGVRAPILVTRARAAAKSRPTAGGSGLTPGAVVPPGTATIPGTQALPAAAAFPGTVSPLTGQVTSPQNQGQTSTSFTLQGQLTGGCGTPCGATAYHGATFQYRVGDSGSFVTIPAADVSNGGAGVSWPVATSVLSDQTGVNSPALTWRVTHTVTSSGLLQIQAMFTDGLGDSYTTSPVTVALDTSGAGGDFATAQVGPVTVGLQSGNLSLPVTDVSVPSFGAGLSVSRTFNSLAAGTSSVFGPGWTSSLPVPGTTMNWSSVTDDGSYAVLTDSGGTVLDFVAGTPSGGVTPYTAQGPAAAQGLVLAKSPAGFTLADPSGDQAQFTVASTNTPSRYTPSQVTRPGSSRSVGYIYDAATGDANYGKVELMDAPNANLPPGTSSTTACPYPASAATWQGGCKGLQFSYDPATGNLAQIDLFYDQQGSLTDVPIADYSYDSSGRLTGHWDPRFSPSLVTGYSYDENPSDANYGWLTSLSPAQSVAGSLAPWTFGYDTTAGTADFGKLVSVTRSHSTGGTATQTIDYEVPLTTAAGGPVNMDPGTVGTWNQTDVPASAVAIFPATHVPSSPPAGSDWQYAQISYYDANGRAVNTADYGFAAWNISTSQYDGYGDAISQLTAGDRAEALAAGSSSAQVAAELESVNTYTIAADGTPQLVDSYGPLHHGSVPGQGVQQIRDHVHYVYDQGAPSTGGPYDLVTTQTATASIGAGIPGTSDADARTTSEVYNNGTDNIGWTLRSPLQTVTDPGGLAITSTTVYNEDPSYYGGEPLVVQTRMPSDTAGTGAGTEQLIYYTGGTNPLDSACGSHAMFADLVCKTEPVAQPGTPGLPSLPVTTYAYNIYQQVLTKTETFGSSTRTTNYIYNALRLPATTTVTTSGPGMGTSIQETVNYYSSATMLLHARETQDSLGNVTGEIKQNYDDFGQLSSYVDAAGNTTAYTYNLAGQVTSRDDGKGTATLSYTGSMPSPSQVVDSQAGTFTAQYSADGSLAAQTYPGGLTATYGYDETGAATSLSYAGESWTSPLSDTVTPNAHGDWASRAVADTGVSLASSQAFSYDSADRLASVQDTEAGQCTTRTYTYNANSDRAALATAPAGTGGACQSANPVTRNYTYDSADRLTSTGYTYDTQGDITTTPAADAGGGGDLAATYYANDLLASQTQNGQTVTWQLDPTETRFGSYTAGAVTYTNHFSDAGNNPTWLSGSDGSWTRNIPGFGGSLAAEVTASGVTLELTDLHGDVMATATTSPASAQPTATYVYNEFGAVESGRPATYGWEGGNQIPGSALGGQLLMGVRAYNPATGRFSQVDPDPGGSANAYDYAFQNPLTQADLTGADSVGAWGPAGFFWVNMFYSWSVRHYIIVFGFWLKCCRYAQLVEWFIWFTGGNGWNSKFGAHWLWTAKRSWQTATWLPGWDQDNWVGAAAQLYWQGYTLVWGWLPVFWGGWSVQLSFAGWK